MHNKSRIFVRTKHVLFVGCSGVFHHPTKEKAATMPSGGHGCSPIRALASAITGRPISPRSDRVHKQKLGEPIVQSDDAQHMLPTIGMSLGQRLEEQYDAVISVPVGGQASEMFILGVL